MEKVVVQTGAKTYQITDQDGNDLGVFRFIPSDAGILKRYKEAAAFFTGINERIKDKDFDVIVGLEARGFMFGTPIAFDMKKAFVPIRKKGKLPWKTISESYDLEYGSAEIEIHTDAIKEGQKVVIVDDLIATGGTVKAAINLVERLGGEVVSCLFLTELAGLNGRKALEGYNVESVVVYEGK